MFFKDLVSLHFDLLNKLEPPLLVEIKFDLNHLHLSSIHT